jgi:hypothetical protein
MRGTLLVNYNETPDSIGSANFNVSVNQITRNEQFRPVNNYYSTFIFPGDAVSFFLSFPNGGFANVTVYRIDYTTDDEGGDNGIKETLTRFTINESTNTFLSVVFPITKQSNSYNFKYVVDCSSGPLPTFYTWSLGYHASSAANACTDYATSPSTYYTTVPTLEDGIYLYDSNTVLDLSDAGYYSNGTNVWRITDTSLPLTNQSPC